MRTELGLIVINLLAIFAGFGVLRAINLVQIRPRSLLSATGIALFLGLALVIQLQIIAAILGLTVSLRSFLLLSFLLGFIGLGIAFWRDRSTSGRYERNQRPINDTQDVSSFLGRSTKFWLATILVGAIFIYLLINGWYASVVPVHKWDAWSFWSRKALILFYYGLDQNVLSTVSNAAYPIFLPLLESDIMRAFGKPNTELVNIEFVILLGTAVWTAFFALSRRNSAILALPILAAFIVTPGVTAQLITGYADVPLALFLGVGVLFMGLWLEQRRSEWLVGSVIFLAAAANTKNEGLLFVFAVIVMSAGLTLIGRRYRLLLHLCGAVFSLLLLIMPWRLWAESHHLQSDYPTKVLAKGLNPSYLIDRLDRVSPALDAITIQIGDERWLFLVPIGIILSVTAIIGKRGLREIGVFYLGTGLLVFLAVLWTYWASIADLPVQLATSIDRTPTSIIALAAFGSAHLIVMIGRDIFSTAQDS